MLGKRRVECGITPAYAGNTFFYYGCRLDVGDHPRLRGEYTAWMMDNNSPMGSPPLTRGIQ